MSGFHAAKLPQCDVLAIGPHPDDVEIGCGGTLLLMKQAGMKIALVDCTRGEMGSRGTAADRDAEAEAAAKALGLDARGNLGLKDTGICDDDASAERVVAAMRAVRPKIVFAPHERDVHPDHTNAAKLIGRAHFLAGLRNYHPELGPAHRAQTLLHYPGNQLVEPTVVVDITAVAEQKLDVVRCYASQIASDENSLLVQGLDLLDRTIVRQRAMGAMIAAAAGEGFCHDGPIKVSDLGWLCS